MKKPLILIAGPTASGKTKSSVKLAQRIGGEIISADSMQVYKNMDIGTAKVKVEEMEGIPHYMIDVLEPSTGCNISWFKEQVTEYIHAIHERGKIPILVGGTGFYINAILFDTQFDEGQDLPSYKEALEEEAKQIGAEALHQKLREIDPESADAIHFNNVKRVIRAIEYYKQTGQTISEHNKVQRAKREQDTSPYNYTFFALDMERSILYDRINQRVDLMVEEGLVEEVRQFVEAGYTEDMTAMQGIGYKELFPYFNHNKPLEACVEELKQNTRHYAKRQLTWFKNQAKPHFIDVGACHFDANQIVEVMLEEIKDIL